MEPGEADMAEMVAVHPPLVEEVVVTLAMVGPTVGEAAVILVMEDLVAEAEEEAMEMVHSVYIILLTVSMKEVWLV